MNRKKEFLTWVLMKYGMGEVIPADLRREYVRGLGEKPEHYMDHPLGWGDYEGNERYGLRNYFNDADHPELMAEMSDEPATLNATALEYINEP